MARRRHYTRFKFEGTFTRGYDAFNHVATLGMDLYWRRKTAEQVSRDLGGAADAGIVLDLACGTGDMACAVARAVPGVRVIGSDPSAEMLSYGRDKLSAWAGRIEVVQAVSLLPFPDGSFSAITCAFGVRNFIALADDLQESLRLLRPGGRLNVLEFFVPENFLIKAVLKSYNALVFPLLGFLLTGRVGPYRYLFNSIFSFKTVPDFSDLLKRTGFADIRIRRFFFGMVHLASGCKPE